MADFVPDIKTLHSSEWLKRHGAALGKAFHCPICSTPESAVVTHTYGDWPLFKCGGCAPEVTIKSLTEIWAIKEDDCDQLIPLREGVVIPNDPTYTPPVTVLCLGYDEEGSFYYQNSLTGHIVKLKAQQHKEDAFYGITPDYQYWFWAFGNPGDQNVNWKKASRSMMAECQLKGRFRLEDVRGGGVWMDEGRVVANFGTHLLVDGIKTKIQGFKSEYLYDAMIKSVRLPTAMSAETARSLVPPLHKLPFTDGTGPLALGGMMVVGLLSGILSWRPHLWLTGAAESGKSSILTHVLSKMWKPVGAAITDESTSAAGIRQKALRQSAVPVVMDEGESDDQQGAARVMGIVKMARSASSDSEAVVFKGTQGGTGMEFKVRSCFVLCSIVEALKTQQDRQRFTVVQCQKTAASVAGWPELKYQLEDTYHSENGLALYAAVIRDARVILNNIRISSRVVFRIMGGDSRRHSDQLGSFIAGYFYLTNMGEEISEAEAERLYHSTNYTEIRQEIKEERDTPIRCLHQIYAYKPQGQMQTLGECAEFLAEKLSEGDLPQLFSDSVRNAQQALRRMGLDVERNKAGVPVLIVATNHPELAEYLERKGYSSHSKLLRRIAGVKSHRTRSFAGLHSHSIMVPMETLGEAKTDAEERGSLSMEDLPWEEPVLPPPTEEEEW